MRTVVVLDGLGFMLGAVAMRWVGPPPFYFPHNVAFPAALARAAVTPILSLLATSTRRRAIAAYANRAGFNHVSISLGDLVDKARVDADGPHSSLTHERRSSASTSVADEVVCDAPSERRGKGDM